MPDAFLPPQSLISLMLLTSIGSLGEIINEKKKNLYYIISTGMFVFEIYWGFFCCFVFEIYWGFHFLYCFILKLSVMM